MRPLTSQQPSDADLAEPLSPELALVDPQLARVARTRLPEVGDTLAGLRRPAAAPGEHAGSPAEHPPSTGNGNAATEVAVRERLAAAGATFEPEAPPGRAARYDEGWSTPRRRRRRMWLAAAATAVVAAAAAVSLYAWEASDVDGQSGSAVPQPADVDGARETETPPTPRSAGDPPNSARPNVSPQTTERPRRQEEPTPRAQQRAVPPRVFVWPPASGATFYRVEFFRRGRKVFEASPATARLELPLQWRYRGRTFRLVRGTYRWEVRAAFGPRSRPRLGRLITRSTWVVS